MGSHLDVCRSYPDSFGVLASVTLLRALGHVDGFRLRRPGSIRSGVRLSLFHIPFLALVDFSLGLTLVVLLFCNQL